MDILQIYSMIAFNRLWKCISLANWFLLELMHVAPRSEKQKGFIVKKQNNKGIWMVEPLKK